jgi:hypothetical protein
MKKILFSAVLLALISSGFAGTPPVVNEKVLEAFKKTFNPQEEVTWYENENSFEARFTSGGIRAVVWYTKNGVLKLIHRYYDAYKLPPVILTSLSKEFPEYELLGVTEITDKAGMLYYITLEGEKNWMKVKVNPAGEFEIYEKFKKG